MAVLSTDNSGTLPCSELELLRLYHPVLRNEMTTDALKTSRWRRLVVKVYSGELVLDFYLPFMVLYLPSSYKSMADLHRGAQTHCWKSDYRDCDLRPLLPILPKSMGVFWSLCNFCCCVGHCCTPYVFFASSVHALVAWILSPSWPECLLMGNLSQPSMHSIWCVTLTQIPAPSWKHSPRLSSDAATFQRPLNGWPVLVHSV